MRCTSCGSGSSIIESKTIHNGRVKHHRQCLRCRFVFTTWEVYEDELGFLASKGVLPSSPSIFNQSGNKLAPLPTSTDTPCVKKEKPKKTRIKQVHCDLCNGIFLSRKGVSYTGDDGFRLHFCCVECRDDWVCSEKEE